MRCFLLSIYGCFEVDVLLYDVPPFPCCIFLPFRFSLSLILLLDGSEEFLPFACLILEGTPVHCLCSQMWVACVEIHDSWAAYGWLCDFLMCLTSFLEPDGWANESTIALKGVIH